MTVPKFKFCVISQAISDELCNDLKLQQENLYSEYRSQHSNDISYTTVPTVTGNVSGDGNCLYRSVCLSISGSERSYMQLKHCTATELIKNRHNFVQIDEARVPALIKSANKERAWGKFSHLIALSIYLRIRIHVFYRTINPPQWQTVPTDLTPNCVSVQVSLNNYNLL